ncbi:MAG: conjugative transposon protein TraN [Crocinitomicaceae bacterium]|nr:conjugative transposon protein TraN [Crocinitomicaceae bacterium]
MKNKVKLWIAVGILSLLSFALVAQEKGTGQLSSNQSYQLEISDTKTSNVIFPYAIVSVDRGSKDVLVQKAKGVEHILQVKAASDSMAQSNLSVVTSDGKLTTFIVNYVRDPASLNMSLIEGKNGSGVASVFNPKDNLNEEQLEKHARTVLTAKSYHPGIKRTNSDISLYLKGIFIKDDALYYRFIIANWSNVSYDIEQLRFFIRDQKRAKRTASQEIEIKPLYVQRVPVRIAGKSKSTFVFALPKFTIPDQKYLAVQMMEKNGGRHVIMKLKNRHILGAKVIK